MCAGIAKSTMKVSGFPSFAWEDRREACSLCSTPLKTFTAKTHTVQYVEDDE